MNELFTKAIKVVLNNEGVYDPEIVGVDSETVFGRDRKNNPEWEGWLIVDEIKKTAKTEKEIENAIIDNNKLLELVSGAYLSEWDKYKLDSVIDEKLAINIFDCLINPSNVAAIEIQQYCGVKEDGIFGDKTIAAINKTNAKNFIEYLKNWRIAYYNSLPDYKNGKPFKLRYISGWTQRAIDTASV